MHRRWFVNKTNPEFVNYLSRNASISRILAQVLINRGIKTVPDIRNFMYAGISTLSDPFLLPDMSIAVARLKSALRGGESILVHGDYDADGLTATAIMVQALRMTGLSVNYFIPHRLTHGYGFNSAGVEAAKNLGAGIVVTVDTGISSFEAIEAAREEGIDVIVTDHHEPLRENGPVKNGSLAKNGFLLPRALALVNPKISPGEDGLSSLSGAGIAFKVAQALALDKDFNFSREDALSFIDLAALGTVADVVPLTGENRIILREGIRHIRKMPRPGISALREVCGLQGKKINARLLSFTLVPRINAAGRIDEARDVVQLLLSDVKEEVLNLGMWLNRLNSERQKIEEEVYQDAMSQLRDRQTDSVIVISGEGWHQGVLGIVASRIAEEFSLPTFVLSVEKEIASGSARSVPSFDVCSGLEECRDLLLSFGGHKQAAGLKLESTNIGKFREKIRSIIQTSLDGRDLLPSLEIDANIGLPDVTFALIGELEMLEPFGYGNTEPLFGTRDLEVISPKLVGGNHLKMRLKENSVSVDTIGFSMGHFLENISSGSRVDAVYTPVINEWNGGRHLQLMLRACRPSV